MNEIHAIIIYFALLFLVAVISSPKKSDSADFFIGRRSMNYWLTAISAHASDMSSWLFMAFPAAIFLFGLFKAWIAIGLLLCMYLNWQFIAPKIRVATENTNSLTFFSYLENKFKSKNLILYCVFICIFFYSIYIASGLIGMGSLIEKIYGLSYSTALVSSGLIILLCVVLGGYRTLAWIDLFQGCFLLFAILFVPFFILSQLGGWELVQHQIVQKQISLSLFPNTSALTFAQIAIMALGWGLGYFGQPAIITKFMGIKHVHETHRAKNIGMIWMSLSLAGAVLVGLVAIAFFQTPLKNPEMVFIEMVQQTFHPFFAGFILCSVFAATINVISSQMLVIGSSFFEDIHKRLTGKHRTNSLFITKIAMCIIFVIPFVIAYFKISSIYNLVLYAWSGLGSAFGPILIFSLHSKRSSKYIAWSAVLSGGISSGLWPWVGEKLKTGIDPMVIGFACSFLAIGAAALFEKWRASKRGPQVAVG